MNDDPTIPARAVRHLLDDVNNGGDDPVTGDLYREHWIVPVHGLTHAEPDGIVQAIARRDGTMSLHLTHGVRVLKHTGRRARKGTVMPHQPEYSHGSFPVCFDDGIWEVLNTSYVTVLERPTGGRR